LVYQARIIQRADLEYFHRGAGLRRILSIASIRCEFGFFLGAVALAAALVQVLKISSTLCLFA